MASSVNSVVPLSTRPVSVVPPLVLRSRVSITVSVARSTIATLVPSAT